MERFRSIKKKINRKVLMLAGVVVLLIGAVVANILVSGNERSQTGATAKTTDEGVTVSTVQTGFFESYRVERDKTRSSEIEYLDIIIAQGADAQTLDDAQQKKLEIVDSMEKEMTVESLLIAKGFRDAAVTVHTGSVNVILSVEEQLSDEQIAQVLDIVIRETGESAENIKVTTAIS